MADISASAPLTPADLQQVATSPQDSSTTELAMSLRRRPRENASPSPAPQRRGSTPIRDPLTGRLVGDRGGTVRTAMPAKYSTSYGSPMTQLPDRSTVGGGGNVTKAAAEIFSKVKKDNVAAEARRRAKDQARAARAGMRGAAASPPPQAIQPSIEVNGLGEESTEAEEQSDGGGSEYDDQAEVETEVRKSPRKAAARKRTRDDNEAEEREEQERKARDARLKRERAAEARRLRARKQAEAQAAAREKAEQERRAEHERRAEEQRLAEHAAREAAAKTAMPPPPPPSVRRLRETEAAETPQRGLMPPDLTPRPPSARSFIEEGNIFVDASLQTPIRPLASAPPPPAQPSPLAPPSSNRAGPDAVSPDAASPPSVLKRPPRRPGGATPGPRIPLPASPRRRGSTTTQETSLSEGSHPSEDEVEPAQSSPSDQYTAPNRDGRLHSRLKSLPSRLDAVDEYEDRIPTARDEKIHESSPDDNAYRRRSRGFSPKHTMSPWSVFKIAAAAFVMLHFIRIAHTLIRPDLFETPIVSVNWYGWRDWTRNVGQFFPSPLLHPLGVLSDDQYDDLRDYLQRRTTTVEAAVDDLRSIIPKVVSVRKDQRGRILVADEFWHALKDRIQQDDKILSLDAKSRLSARHWRAIQQQLKEAGLLNKPLSSEDVTRIVEKAAPSSWEKWLKENQQKVADVLDKSKSRQSPAARPTDGAVVTREEFIRELKDHLSRNAKQIDGEMDSLRKELHGLLHEVRATASAGGMTKAEIRTLIKEIVDKEVARRQIHAASKSGGQAVDAAMHRQLNHFCPGNGAMIDFSQTSPTYMPRTPPFGSAEWRRTMRTQPQFLADHVHALTPWADAGHCWCAAILGADNRTLPADVAVKLRSPVVPRYLVLEHIDPSTTADPLSMPRDVEVWAAFGSEDGGGGGDARARRERVLSWMAATFPSATADPLVSRGLAKIGQFTYEHRAADGGVHVHRLPDALADTLAAATDLVLVRAVTNHGARDHTCFYRIRMYGDAVGLG